MTTCKKAGYTLIGLQVTDCYCGRFMPPTDTLVKDEKCNFPCPGFGTEACGSKTPKHYSIWNLGDDMDPPVYEEEGEDEEEEVVSSTNVAAPSSTAAVPPEKTVIESEAPESDKDKGDDDSSPNVAGIVAGVVVGVVVVAGSAAGLWFFMRRRRNSEIEEEHRRNAAVNAFISGSKPPGSSGSISMTDSRLDPVMAHRRMSDGSIADNEDYSRKILRVRWNLTFPDSSISTPNHDLGYQRMSYRTEVTDALTFFTLLHSIYQKEKKTTSSHQHSWRFSG